MTVSSKFKQPSLKRISCLWLLTSLRTLLNNRSWQPSLLKTIWRLESNLQIWTALLPQTRPNPLCSRLCRWLRPLSCTTMTNFLPPSCIKAVLSFRRCENKTSKFTWKKRSRNSTWIQLLSDRARWTSQSTWFRISGRITTSRTRKW